MELTSDAMATYRLNYLAVLQNAGVVEDVSLPYALSGLYGVLSFESAKQLYDEYIRTNGRGRLFINAALECYESLLNVDHYVSDNEYFRFLLYLIDDGEGVGEPSLAEYKRGWYWMLAMAGDVNEFNRTGFTSQDIGDSHVFLYSNTLCPEKKYEIRNRAFKILTERRTVDVYRWNWDASLSESVLRGKTHVLHYYDSSRLTYDASVKAVRIIEQWAAENAEFRPYFTGDNLDFQYVWENRARITNFGKVYTMAVRRNPTLLLLFPAPIIQPWFLVCAKTLPLDWVLTNTLTQPVMQPGDAHVMEPRQGLRGIWREARYMPKTSGQICRVFHFLAHAAAGVMQRRWRRHRERRLRRAFARHAHLAMPLPTGAGCGTTDASLYFTRLPQAIMYLIFYYWTGTDRRGLPRKYWFESK